MRLSSPAEHRIIDIMCDIHISPISIFDECCEILQKHGIASHCTGDQLHKLYENMFNEINNLGDTVIKRHELHWWQTSARRGMEQNIKNVVERIKTYSKAYETEVVLAMEEVEQLEKRLAQNKDRA